MSRNRRNPILEEMQSYILEGDQMRDASGALSQEDPHLKNITLEVEKAMDGGTLIELLGLPPKQKGGLTRLQYLISKPFDAKKEGSEEKLYTPQQAEEIALCLWKAVTTARYWSDDAESRKALFLPYVGHLSILQTAILTGSPEIFDKVIDECLKLYEETFQTLLNHRSENNYSLLHDMAKKRVTFKTFELAIEACKAHLDQNKREYPVLLNSPTDQGLYPIFYVVQNGTLEKIQLMAQQPLSQRSLSASYKGKTLLEALAENSQIQGEDALTTLRVAFITAFGNLNEYQRQLAIAVAANTTDAASESTSLLKCMKKDLESLTQR